MLAHVSQVYFDVVVDRSYELSGLQDGLDALGSQAAETYPPILIGGLRFVVASALIENEHAPRDAKKYLSTKATCAFLRTAYELGEELPEEADLSVLEQGTTSLVLSCDDNRVLKLLKYRFMENVRMAEALAGSRLTLEALSGLAVPQVLDLDQQEYEQTRHLWLELIEGENLGRYCKYLRTQPDSWFNTDPTRFAAHVTASVAQILAKAAERGYSHLDLNPENIMVRGAEPGDGANQALSHEVCLIDWGVNSLLLKGGSTGSGSSASNLVFIPHEIREGASRTASESSNTVTVDSARADAYSLAMVFLSMLTSDEITHPMTSIDDVWDRCPRFASIIEPLTADDPVLRRLSGKDYSAEPWQLFINYRERIRNEIELVKFNPDVEPSPLAYFWSLLSIDRTALADMWAQMKRGTPSSKALLAWILLANGLNAAVLLAIFIARDVHNESVTGFTRVDYWWFYLLAYAFSSVCALYYVTMLGSLRIGRRHPVVAALVRSMSFAFIVPTIASWYAPATGIAWFSQLERNWPFFSGIGLLWLAIVNLALYLHVRRADRLLTQKLGLASSGLSPVSRNSTFDATRTLGTSFGLRQFLKRFQNWPTMMFVYAGFNLVVWVLLNADLGVIPRAQDWGMYVFIVVAVNIVVMGMKNCVKDGAEIRTGLVRLTSMLALAESIESDS